MSDPFADRLRRAIPEPPELTGLAGRAELSARGKRRRRRAVLVAGAAFVVATAVALPFAVTGDRTHTPPPPQTPNTDAPPPESTSTDGPTSDCRATKPTHRDFARGTAAWARFCPLHEGGHPVQGALVSQAVLTDNSAAVVRPWQKRAHDYPHGCRAVDGAAGFSVQVGFEDGTVAEVRGNTGACQAFTTRFQQAIEGSSLIYEDLAGALAVAQARAADAFIPKGPRNYLACPASADEINQNLDIAGVEPPGDTGPLLELPAVRGAICSYPDSGSSATSTPLTPDEAEQIRIAVGGSFVTPPTRVSGGTIHHRAYLVMLADKTSTQRTFTLTGPHLVLTLARGTPGNPQHFGRAGEMLLWLVTGSSN